jgi:hypothetical protein
MRAAGYYVTVSLLAVATLVRSWEENSSLADAFIKAYIDLNTCSH